MNWMKNIKMAEAGEEGGGETQSTPVAINEKQDAPAAGEGSSSVDTKISVPDEEPKPFLGKGDDDGQKAEGNKKEVETPSATEEEYLKAMVKDEALLGNNKNLVLDENLYKAMIPKAQELGVTPEAMNKLANAMAKAQMDRARESMRDRLDYFEKMKTESIRKYSQKDFEQINSGIDKWFKPNGVMNNVIRNSELGADPEFLALMHYLGAAAKEDGLSGVSAGGGGNGADPNSTDGLAKMW